MASKRLCEEILTLLKKQEKPMTGAEIARALMGQRRMKTSIFISWLIPANSAFEMIFFGPWSGSLYPALWQLEEEAKINVRRIPGPPRPRYEYYYGELAFQA